MHYSLNLAGVSIFADVPFSLYQSEKTEEFIKASVYADHDNDGLIKATSSAALVSSDLCFRLSPTEALPEVKNIQFQEPRRIYVRDGHASATFFSSHPDRSPYAYVSRKTIRDGYLNCLYLPGNEVYMNYTHNLITLMDIETTLLDFDALILHASFICWHDMGIIFSAPSGTGKSTQADLWAKYQGAEVLNGDRAALRKVDGLWRAYGLPYAGTSGIYRNESASLKAIVALRQAKENRIREIRGAEAFRYLYPETMIHRWDPDFERRATDLLLQLIGDIPVYLLECLPDEGAVKLLHDTIA